MMPRATLVLAGALVASACGTSADDRSTGVSSGAATTSSVGSGGASATSGGAGGAGGASCPEPEPTSGSGGGSTLACNERGTIPCFSSYQCADDERCENVGTADDPIVCCMKGPRGQGKAGAPCASEFHCASSLCIEGVGECFGSCSDRCNQDSQCPPSLPHCILIGFSGTDDKFCSP
ncbi:MAG: hypothetical protein FJ096_16970 [Deltaproteobacteria bacterium]|nr:hypothetical protein [Deltaproteobacteria bacterium]